MNIRPAWVEFTATNPHEITGLNRMVKAGLLHEEQDAADKRSRLLRMEV